MRNIKTLRWAAYALALVVLTAKIAIAQTSGGGSGGGWTGDGTDFWSEAELMAMALLSGFLLAIMIFSGG
jgi:hypothetical protein